MTALLLVIPSPSSGTLEIGPLKLNAYGLMIALGVVAAVWLAGRRLEQRGIGKRDDISEMALWAVPAGVIGARLYHVVTDWSRFSDNPGDIVKIWEGGLGIWGGIALGVIVGLWVMKRKGLPIALTLTCVTPALPLAQSIGRWGNWWNQELFGKPTDLPWALEVSSDTAVKAGELPGTTFHPTFLYESIGCLLIAVVLVLIDRRVKLRPGLLFFVYTAMYTFMRFFIEGLRVDPATEAGGLRLNQWTSIVVFSVSVLILVVYSISKGNNDERHSPSLEAS
ncbi:MAG: prolipoprotein diacylglyceryl transferase [Actinobacteria bacterium]|jgi:prolipoprotein diacylglyceryl transferase|nr:prolipoprotein diacylglyceryl transferase [Actinomycetota bacterium]